MVSVPSVQLSRMMTIRSIGLAMSASSLCAGTSAMIFAAFGRSRRSEPLRWNRFRNDRRAPSRAAEMVAKPASSSEFLVSGSDTEPSTTSLSGVVVRGLLASMMVTGVSFGSKGGAIAERRPFRRRRCRSGFVYSACELLIVNPERALSDTLCAQYGLIEEILPRMGRQVRAGSRKPSLQRLIGLGCFLTIERARQINIWTRSSGGQDTVGCRDSRKG